MKLLEVGDVVYFDMQSSMTRFKIKRVTPKFAFTENGIKLGREIRDDGRIKRGEYIKWDTTQIYLATPELNEKFLNQQYSYFLSNRVVWHDVPLDIKLQVYELVKAYRTEEKK